MSDVKTVAKEQETSASNAVATARTLEIRTRPDMVKAVSLVQSMMDGVDRVDEVMDELIKPLEVNIKELKSFFKAPKTMFQTAIGAAKSKLYVAMKAEEGSRTAEEEKLTAEAQVSRQTLLKEAEGLREAGMMDKAVLKEVQAESMVSVVMPDDAKVDGAYIRETWKAEVIDMNAFLHEILMEEIPINMVKVDTAALNKMAASTKGLKAISGVRFFKEDTLVVRR